MTKTTAPVKKVLDKETAMELSEKMLPSIKIQNDIFLSDRKRSPSIAFYPDEQQFFDPIAYAIHLGIYGPIVYFGVDNEEDYVSGVDYLFGHENQHARSTATVPYSNGIKRAAHAIIEYIANQEGIRKNFRNDKDYDVFVNAELPSKGIHINMNAVMGICSRLLNGVDDGRIERIRSLEFPGFEKKRRYFRAIVWNQDHEYKPYADGLNDEDKLNLFALCILSLATTGLYPKGFVAEYGNTPIMTEVQAFMPYIAKGILAKRTRYMADNAVEIAKLLAPYIYSVSKYDPSAAQKAFENLIKEMLKQLVYSMEPDKMAPTSEREEEQDDGIPLPVFPMSDLVITLDDETYDKLMEKAKKSGKDGGGIMVRREHPKEEEKKEDQQEGNGSDSGGEKSEDQKNSNGSGNGQNGEQSDENGNQNGNGQSGDQSNGQDGQGESDGNGQQSGESANSTSSSNGQNSSQNGTQPYSKEYSKSQSGGIGDGKSEQGSHQSGGGEGGSEEMVMEQMKQAARECRDDASEKLSTINSSIEHTAKNNRGNAPIHVDKDKPISPSEMKDICSHGFKEVKREYKLDKPLPTVLNARARTFRKKNERYFKSLSSPNVSHLDNGSIDPSRIYSLAFGETNVFRKIGIDKVFDGCVYVLVDNSGSMAGNKRMEAAKAAAVIEEGFSTTCSATSL